MPSPSGGAGPSRPGSPASLVTGLLVGDARACVAVAAALLGRQQVRDPETPAVLLAFRAATGPEKRLFAAPLTRS